MPVQPRAVLALIAAFAAGAVAAPFGYFRAQRWAAEDLAVLVGAQVPPKRAELAAWLTERAAQARRWRITLLGPDGSLELSFAELGLSLDVDASRLAVEQCAPPMPVFSRILRELRPRPELSDVPLTFHLDADKARAALAALAPGVAREPVDARIDLVAHAKIDDRPGRALDVERTLARLPMDARDDLVVPLALATTPAQVTSAALADVDVTRVLSAYETDFTHHAGPRAINIATAARYLNGALIPAGQEFSFNKTVGARTFARGFVEAPVIVLDELEPGVGGGVCQVASTLHAAAVLGDFEVLQRRSHSRPSGYAPLGLDATVVDGELDLKLRNPYDSAVMVHAFLPTKTSLRIELLGRDPPGRVEHFYAVKETHEFFRRVVVDQALAPNQSKRHQKGSLGYDVVSTVRTIYPDGSKRFRSYTSTYAPVPEVYWIGPGSEPGTLPALPEGANHVEIAPAGTSG